MGTVSIGAGVWTWPDGGVGWDIASGVGTVFLAFGAEGFVNIFTEKNRPET